MIEAKNNEVISIVDYITQSISEGVKPWKGQLKSGWVKLLVLERE